MFKEKQEVLGGNKSVMGTKNKPRECNGNPRRECCWRKPETKTDQACQIPHRSQAMARSKEQMEHKYQDSHKVTGKNQGMGQKDDGRQQRAGILPHLSMIGSSSKLLFVKKTQKKKSGQILCCHL